MVSVVDWVKSKTKKLVLPVYVASPLSIHH